MKASYLDIKSKIKEEPLWYDENGTPRYEKFSPELSPNIYAEKVVLLEIACQDCKQRFLVEMNWSPMNMILDRHSESFSSNMRQYFKSRRESNYSPIHYGDPPIHGCVGDTMNCYDLRIVEFHKKDNLEFRRMKEYEIELEKIGGEDI